MNQEQWGRSWRSFSSASGRKNNKGSRESERKTLESIEEETDEERHQFPIKLEFKIPRDVRIFYCAAEHREWFYAMKKNARMITYKEMAVKEGEDFPKTQEQYNKAFPQRITKQLGQPRATEIIFEIEIKENFHTLKAYNTEMLSFLRVNGIYMKMNSASALRRDTVGFFTHIHPRAMWRVDYQERIIEQMKKNMCSQEIEKAMESADDKARKELFVTLNFRMQYIKSNEGLIQMETLEV